MFIFFVLGNYFSSHFIMGDQTFAGTHPECFLFGENNDLNFLSSRPVAVRICIVLLKNNNMYF